MKPRPDGRVPVYTVVNESDHVVAHAEGRVPEVYALHRTEAGALRSLTELRLLHPDDVLGIRAMFVRPEELDDPDFPIGD